MRKIKNTLNNINCLIFFIVFCIFNNCFSSEKLLEKAIQNNERLPKHIDRDQYRNPEKTLIFFGISPDMNVLEILPGKGYYTEILANYLNKKGKLTVANFGKDNKNEYLRSIHINFENYFKKKKFGKIEIKKFNNKGYLSDISSNSIDLVLTFRNTHNWIQSNSVKDIYKSMHRVLKKNGVLGVVQHRANDSMDVNLTSKKGYVSEKYLIDLLNDLNFQFDSKTEINSNSLDTKDYPDGVWTLPPTFSLKEKNKKKYEIIGESDRMTLRFIKK